VKARGGVRRRGGGAAAFALWVCSVALIFNTEINVHGHFKSRFCNDLKVHKG